MEGFVAGFIALILLIIAGLSARWYLRSQHSKSYDHTIYLVAIPQYSEVSKKQEPSQKFQERLAEVENLFSVLAATKAESALTDFFVGRSDHFSLEMVSLEGTIFFYASLPTKLANLFIQQIHSVYPHAHLEPISDYNIFQPHGVIRGGYVTFRRSFIFPLRTYKAFERDPLEGLTTALGRVPQNGGAAIQLIVRSARKSWHTAGRRVANEVYKGSSLKDAIAHLGHAKGFWGILGKIITSIFSLLSASFSSSKKEDEIKRQTGPSQLSPKDQEAVKGIEEKASKAGFDANIRILVSMPAQPEAELQLRNIMDAFGQYNIYEYGNAFKSAPSKNQTKLIRDFIYRNYVSHANIILNAEETTTLFHLPEHIMAPNINWLKAKKLPPPVGLPLEGTLLGYSVYRNQSLPVRIKDNDRRRHLYIIGQTGVGKSELIKHLALQDIQRGKGICLIDPHGDGVESLLQHIPHNRANDVILFDPADTERPLALNMLEYETPDQKTFVINEMIKIFDKLYDLKQTGGPMFEQYMRNAMLLIMDDPESGSTLLEIPKVMADEKFRRYKLSKSTNPVVKDFWEKEAQKAGGEAALANMVPYVTSKLTQFIANDTMRPIIAQQKSSFNFRTIMDEQKILLINLSKGKIGDMNSYLLGMVIVGKILMGALSRVDTPEDLRKDFYLYIDEFQNYTTDSIAIILSEARKYKLNLTIAHQYLGQLVKQNDTSIRDAVFGNVGTMVAFRVGVDDAETIAQQFAPVVSEYDVMNIEKYSAYVRLLIDNQNVPAFNIRPEPLPRGNAQQVRIIKELCRIRLGRPRSEIEAEIVARTRVATPVVDKAPLPL